MASTLFEACPRTGEAYLAGHSPLEGPPPLKDSRCKFECGLFTETVPGFTQTFAFSAARTVVHMDADLYSSTLFVLVTIAPMLKAGDIIIFDEFADVMNEFRALLDVMSCIPLKLTVIGAVNWGNKVAFAVG